MVGECRRFEGADVLEAAMKHVDVKQVGQVVVLTPPRALFGDDEIRRLPGECGKL